MKGSAFESKQFQRRNSRLSQAGRTAEPFQIQIELKVLHAGLAHEKFGVLTGPY